VAVEIRPPATPPPAPRPGALAGLRRGGRLYYGYWIALAALVAQFVAVGGQMSVAGTFFKPMTEDLGWTRTEFTYAQTVGNLVMAFVGFYVGAYVDRLGCRRVMVLGAVIVGVALVATSQVSALWHWLLVRGVFFTVGAALIGNLVVNVTLSKWFVEQRGRVIGFAAMGVSLAGIVMPPAWTWVIDGYGWRAAWVWLAVLVVGLTIPCALVMRRQPEDHGLYPDGKTAEEIEHGAGEAAARDFANSFTRAEAVRTPAFYLLVLAFGLGMVGIGALLLQTIPFLTDEGFSRGAAALISTTMSIPALLSKPFWGWATDRGEPRRLAAIGFVTSGAAIVLVLYAAKNDALAPLIGGFLLMGLGFGGQIPVSETIWARYFGRRYFGSVRSAAMPFSIALGASAPLAVSFYFDIVGNYDGAFLTIAVLLVLAAVMILLVRPPARVAAAASALEPVAPPAAPP